MMVDLCKKCGGVLKRKIISVKVEETCKECGKKYIRKKRV